MKENLFKLVGIVVVSCFILYMVAKLFRLQTSVIEGLTSSSTDSTASTTSTTDGEAGNAASYAAVIKAQVTKLSDELLISKYRTDYEQTIIQLDDYIGYLMLKQILNIDFSSDNTTKTMISIANIQTLNNAKTALNTAMTFVDKQ